MDTYNYSPIRETPWHWTWNSKALLFYIVQYTQWTSSFIHWPKIANIHRHRDILTVILFHHSKTTPRNRRWERSLLPLQVKLVRFLVSCREAEVGEERTNTAAYQQLGTMFHPCTVNENVKSYESYFTSTFLFRLLCGELMFFLITLSILNNMSQFILIISKNQR
jgi:hypothetical protein